MATNLTRDPRKETLLAVAAILGLVVSLGAQEASQKPNLDPRIKEALEQNKKEGETQKPSSTLDDRIKKALKEAEKEETAPQPRPLPTLPAPAAKAEEPRKDAGKGTDRDQRRTMITKGYTRPGNISDQDAKKEDEGKEGLAGVAFEPIKSERLLGGTVYFAVFDRYGGKNKLDETDRAAAYAAEVGDAWATGMSDLNGRFVPGKSKTVANARSPRLDTKARYLYLYQVVNDRGTVKPTKKGAGILPVAADDEKKGPKIEDVAGFSLKLMVDPRYITSWGHFQHTGFASDVNDKKINKKEGFAPVAADDDEPGDGGLLRVAMSADVNVQSVLPEKRYRRYSPAYDLGKLDRTFGLASDRIGLAETSEFKEIDERERDGLANVAAWAQNLHQAARTGGIEPEFVEVKYFGTTPGGVTGGLDPVAAVEGRRTTDDEMVPAIFRVDWPNLNKNNKTYLSDGFQSVAFGFTSDLPPINLPIRLDDPQAARTVPPTEGLRQVAADDDGPAGPGTGLAPASAPGTAPGISPSPQIALAGANVAGETGATSAGGGMSTMGGMPGGLGGGMGMPAAGGVGSMGGAGTPLVTGGGGRSGGGGSNGNGNGTPTTTTPTPVITGTNNGIPNSGLVNVNAQPNINFNASLSNQQSQAQSQAQAQAQSQLQAQAQSNCCSSPSAVVPEPSSLLLGAFGLPGLFFLRRRQDNA